MKIPHAIQNTFVNNFTKYNISLRLCMYLLIKTPLIKQCKIPQYRLS